MTAFILPLSDPAATDPENVGPKAANLASLTQAGLPTPGGFSLTAAAYRHQLRHLGLDTLLTQYNEADLPTSRKLSIFSRTVRMWSMTVMDGPPFLLLNLAARRASRPQRHRPNGRPSVRTNNLTAPD